MPCPQDEFRFLLQGQGFSRTYRLCARNDFCVYFDDLMEGSYEISEVDENWNVRYRVNGCLLYTSYQLLDEKMSSILQKAGYVIYRRV